MAKRKPPMSKIPNPAKQSSTPAVSREGTPIFNTKSRKYVTPGLWHKADGPANNVTYWDFWKREEEVRNRQRITLEYHYDKERNRI